MGKSKDLATGNSAFYQDQTESDARYVNVAGDTMTGNLGVNGYIDLNTSGNRAKLGYDSNNVYIGSTSGTGALYFKNNISSTDAPHSSGDTKMIISDNAVTKPNQPHFHANRAGLSNEYRNGNVNYNVVRDTASGWNSSNHQYTIPVTGVYHFGFNNIGHSGVDGSDQYHALQFVRGGTTTFIASAYNTNDAQHENTNIAITYYLQANDLVQMRNYGGVVYSGFYNTFSIYLLG